MAVKKYTTAEPRWLEQYGRWQVNVQKDGRRKTFSSSIAGRKGKAEVMARATEWLQSMDADNIRLYAAWDRFMTDQQKNTSKSNWIKHDSHWRTHIKPTIPDKRLDSVTPFEWQACINHAAQEGASRRTCINVRATIIRFRSFCELNLFAHAIPSSSILSIPKNVRDSEHTILQPDDLRRLFGTTAVSTFDRNGIQHDKPIYYIYAWRFLVATGLRPGELIALTRNSVRDGILYVRHSVNVFDEVTDGKNQNAIRHFVLTPLALQILDDQAAMLKRMGIVSPYLFPASNGSRTISHNLTRAWCHTRDNLFIQSSLYELRHTYISIVKSDMPDPLLRAVVGHGTKIDTYAVYGHEVDGDMQRAANVADAVFASLLDDKAKNLKPVKKPV